MLVTPWANSCCSFLSTHQIELWIRLWNLASVTLSSNPGTAVVTLGRSSVTDAACAHHVSSAKLTQGPRPNSQLPESPSGVLC